MWQKSEKCAMFMLLWFIASATASGGWFPVVATVLATGYALATVIFTFKGE